MDFLPWPASTQQLARSPQTRTMREDEIRRRALTLANLGYSAAEAEARLAANAAWECELLGKPVVTKRITTLVSEAFTKAGATRGKAAPAHQRAKKKR